MSLPFHPFSTDLKETIARIVKGIKVSVAGTCGKSTVLVRLALLLGFRLDRLQKRLQTLIDHVAAGTLPVPRPRTAAPRAKRAPTPPEKSLPTEKQWLLRIGTYDTQQCIAQFSLALVRDPEMLALIAAAPVQAGRILRSFSRIFGIPIIASLQLPPRPKPAPDAPKRTRAPRAPRAFRWPIPEFKKPAPPPVSAPVRVDRDNPIRPYPGVYR